MKVRLTEKAMIRLKRGHPWIFRSDLAAIEADQSGPVEVLSPKGKSVGQGLYSKKSQIALRMMTRSGEKINSGLIRQRLQAAMNARRSLLGGEETYRWVFGESDGLPSLIIDRYEKALVLQTLSAGMEYFKADIVQLLRDLDHPEVIVERNDVTVREKEGLPMSAQVIWGEGPTEFEISLLGKKILVPLLQGQKTGLFLDQRFNAPRVAPWLKGRVLDAFCYNGQTALHASAHAETVFCVDQSEGALNQVTHNARLNGYENIQTHRANVFDFLKEQDGKQEKWDAITLDPPAFVKNRSEKSGALRGYKEINLRAMKLLKPGGILVTSSCSQNLSREDFLEVLRQGAHDAHRSAQIVMELSQAPDHPVLLPMPESHYLKGFVLRMGD
jgi:23S rRNA (cytosine1962-C5)-methyltransferase